MLMEIVSIVIVVLILVNWVLGEKLYKEPKNTNFFNNVTGLNAEGEKYLMADPRYVVEISILTGIAIGSYMALSTVYHLYWLIEYCIIILLLAVYLMEITRNITLIGSTLTLSRFLMKKKKIEVQDISGMYIYSFNKKFLNKHAYTTKLVITPKNGKRVKFSLSSLDNRAVLNLLTEHFGINSNKMYIASQK